MTSTASSYRAQRLYLDSADIKDWERFLPLGVFYGVTTNPLLLQRAGLHYKDAGKTLCEAAQQFPGIEEIMLQAVGRTAEEYFHSGLELLALDPNRVVVKLPLTEQGVVAAARLRREASDARICMTACYAATQGFLAAGLEAAYIAPYLGRMSDRGSNGLQECSDLHRVVGGASSETRVLVASIRKVGQLVALRREGLDTFTLSPSICGELVANEDTEKAAQEFSLAAGIEPL